VVKRDTSLHIAQSPTKENHLPNIIKNQVMMKMTRNNCKVIRALKRL
jgi:hypothetical protein